MLQAKPGRSGKQQEEQHSPNLGTAFQPSPVIALTFEEYEVGAKVTQNVLDLETAVVTSVRSVFPQTRITFCFFTSIVEEITKDWITGKVF